LRKDNVGPSIEEARNNWRVITFLLYGKASAIQYTDEDEIIAKYVENVLHLLTVKPSSFDRIKDIKVE
jgi:hypothetical protein